MSLRCFLILLPFCCFTLSSGAHYRGISVVNDNIAWLSGSGGAVLRTTNGGTSWDTLNPKGYETKDFRDIHAWNTMEAIVMSSGDSGVVLYTKNGGQKWKMVYHDFRKSVFFDAMDVQNKRVVLVGDGIEGNNPYLMSGKNYKKLNLSRLIYFPPFSREDSHRGHPGPEYHQFFATASLQFNAFAASGTNIFWSENASKAVAILTAHDSTWFVQLWPHQKGKVIGIMSFNYLPFLRADAGGAYSMGVSDSNLIAVGGSYLTPDFSDSIACFSVDGGKTWALSETMPGGYRSCVYQLPGTSFWFCTGTNGTDFSADNGRNWESTALEGYNTIASSTQYLWMAGNKGSWKRIHLSQILP